MEFPQIPVGAIFLVGSSGSGEIFVSLPSLLRILSIDSTRTVFRKVPFLTPTPREMTLRRSSSINFGYARANALPGNPRNIFHRGATTFKLFVESAVHCQTEKESLCFLIYTARRAAALLPVIPPFLRSEIIPEDSTRWKSTPGKVAPGVIYDKSWSAAHRKI